VSVTPASTRSSVAGSSWLLLSVVLAGLFAMHGLGTHGTHAAHGTESMPMAVSSAAVDASVEDATTRHSPRGVVASAGPASASWHARDALARAAAEMSTSAMSTAVASTTAVAHLVGLPGAVRATSQVGEGDVPAGLPAAGLLGLCFAVLTALVAWLLARGRVVHVVGLVPRVTQVVAARGPGRDRDPPSLLVLSVHRC
jgi:hypothetical protein